MITMCPGHLNTGEYSFLAYILSAIETRPADMRIAAETLDDTLRQLYPALLASTQHVSTSRGDTREIVGVLIEITKPRARLSRTETRGKPFSCLGELLWYLSGSDSLDFIRYYIPRYADESVDKTTVYGAYGPRLFCQRGNNQLTNVIKQLSRNPNTRRAVIQIFDAEDLALPHKEIPCTTTLQFLRRNDRMHCVATMRSNDAYKGLPHDVFCFTMLQEIVARCVGARIGAYYHIAGSMHLYENDCDVAKQFLNEGLQQRVEMPRMPSGDPWPAIRKILDAEDRVRMRETLDIKAYRLNPYWEDMVRLLQIFDATGDEDRLNQLKAMIVFKPYTLYIEPRKAAKPRKAFQPAQLTLRFNSD